MCILQQLPFYDTESDTPEPSNDSELSIIPNSSFTDDKYTFPSDSGLKIGHLNIRSINNKKR